MNDLGDCGHRRNLESFYIGADTYGAPDSRLLEPDEHLHHTSGLPHLVSHEVVHFNQFAAAPISYQRQWSNLARAIKEGAADFVAERVSGSHINKRAHAYGLLHEAELWRRFERDKLSGETGDWFWKAPADSLQPPDIGYFIGYRIVQSWFARHGHEPDAMIRLMSITDYPQFLDESGYGRSPSAAGVTPSPH